MADESLQEKTLEPTAKKRREAADEGQVPRSQEVTTAFLLLAGAAALGNSGGTMATAIVDLFGNSVASLTVLPVGPQAAADHLNAVGWTMLVGLAPILLTLSGTALAVSAVQARGVLSAKPIEPKWSRLDPLKKAKEIWGIQAVVEFLKSLLKLLVVSVAVYLALRAVILQISTLGEATPFALLALTQRFAVRILLFSGIAYLALAAADYAYQLWRHEKQLKMTREEVKREIKDSDGDEVIKVRRRTMARQLARRRMLISVSDADVVITNPTHVAVALKYEPAKAHAPTVLAMGERKVAEKIKELAKQHGVPTIENQPLARALLSTGKVGQAIPLELFVAVAEILAFVYKTRGAGVPGYARGGWN